MGILQNLIEMSGSIVARKVDSSVYNWMVEISKIVDGSEGGGSSFNTRYVDKTGVDTNDGSFGSPFLTIQAAVNSITDAASTKVYRIAVGSGVFTDVFVLQPWMFIVGASRMTTVLNPVSTNWIGTGFSATGTLRSGILNCLLASQINVDFSLVASPGAGTFFVLDCNYDGVGSSFIGGNAGNVVFTQNCEQIGTTAGLTHLYRNLVANITHVMFRSNNVTIDNTGAFAGSIISRLGAIYESAAGANGIITISGPVGSLASLNSVILTAFGLQDPSRLVITGDGVLVSGPSYYQVVGPNATTTFDFTGITIGATKLVNSGENYVTAVPTANRTYTFNTPSDGTRIRLKNRSAFFITLVLTGSTNNDTFISPNGYLDMMFVNGVWAVQNTTQFGTTTLVNGVSPAIPADITALSTITVTVKTFSGAAGVPAALGADRTVGLKGAGGQFIVKSITQAAGATVATDQGTYDWQVVG